MTVLVPNDIELLLWLRRVSRTGMAREIRKAHGLTQTEGGIYSGVSGKAIALWETGRRVPRGEPALRYARLLKKLSREKVT